MSCSARDSLSDGILELCPGRTDNGSWVVGGVRNHGRHHHVGEENDYDKGRRLKQLKQDLETQISSRLPADEMSEENSIGCIADQEKKNF